MKKQWLTIIVSFILVIILPLYWLGQTLAAKDANPQAINGLMDLREWDSTTDGPVRLVGEWEFYRGELLTPEDFAHYDPTMSESRPSEIVGIPGKWNRYLSEGGQQAEGYATFRLTLQLRNDEGNVYGIRTTNIRNANRVFLNGEEVGASGVPGIAEDEGVQNNIPFVGFAPVTGDTVEVIVQVANYSYSSGGMIYPLVFGKQQEILKNREFHLFVDFMTLAGFLIPAIFFLFLYQMRKQETALLYLGLFCLTGLVYVLTHGEKLMAFFLPGLEYEWFLKIQFLSSGLAYYFLIHYVSASIPASIHQRALQVANVVMVLVVLIFFTLPVRIFSAWEGVIFFVSFLGICYTIGGMIKATRKYSGDMLFMLISIQAIFVIIVVNILHVSGVLEDQVIVPYEMLLFVMAQALMLGKRFAKSFHDVEQLSTRLLTLDGLKDEFMANTSHELRTPLHGIINIAESLLKGAAGRLNPKQEQHLSMVLATGKRLSGLIDDILDFAKLKTGELHLQQKAVDLQSVVESVIQVAGHLVKDKEINLVQQVPKALPLLYTDEDKLYQILYNLVGNAIKFTRDGEIAISAQVVGKQVQVSVKDTGIGIAQDKLEDIFIPFDQVEREGWDYEGTGLGLSISKKLVELGGGQIWVESQLNQGSVFHFTLPIAQQDQQTKQQDKVNVRSPITNTKVLRPTHQASEMLDMARQRNPYTVLIVDDDPVNLQVLINLLSMEQYTVIAVSNGEEALKEIVHNNQIDLVIVDWMMPGLSGIDLVRLIRQDYLISELPILMLTARSRSEDIQVCFQAGVNDYLSKPVDSGELRVRVRTLLQLRRSVQNAVRTEIAFFQAQIKPHFLFNALNTIISICPVDPDKAMELMLELSQYLRSSFDFQNREPLTSLNKELELVQSYLSLEQARFEDRLQVLYKVGNVGHRRIPPLSIQPIVENAVRHGVMQKAEGGTVRLKVEETEQSIRISISDDGMGMTAEQKARLLEEKTKERGVGLINIHRRLKLLYGKGLHIESQVGVGTTVSFEIPISDGDKRSSSMQQYSWLQG